MTTSRCVRIQDTKKKNKMSATTSLAIQTMWNDIQPQNSPQQNHTTNWNFTFKISTTTRSAPRSDPTQQNKINISTPTNEMTTRKDWLNVRHHHHSRCLNKIGNGYGDNKTHPDAKYRRFRIQSNKRSTIYNRTQSRLQPIIREMQYRMCDTSR